MFTNVGLVVYIPLIRYRNSSYLRAYRPVKTAYNMLMNGVCSNMKINCKGFYTPSVPYLLRISSLIFLISS